MAFDGQLVVGTGEIRAAAANFADEYTSANGTKLKNTINVVPQ